MRIRKLVLAAVASAAAICPAIAGTPVPNVKGPLPVTASTYPFGAADHTLMPQDLKRMGYVEEEFLISGTANVYDWPQLGPLQYEFQMRRIRVVCLCDGRSTDRNSAEWWPWKC